MPSKHALLSPSNHRWPICTPSARLEEKFPNVESQYTVEGTRAHAICEAKLKDLLGEPHELAEPTDSEMENCAESYKDYVEELFNEAKASTPDAKLFVELELDLSDYVPESFGTSDAVIVSDDTLTVVDFKYGKGVQVTAAGNSQLRLYALGAYMALGDLYEFTHVKTVVFQPRISNIDSESLEVSELLSWAEDYIKPRATLAFEGKGDFVVGDHCRFCKAGAICRARAEEAFEILEREKLNPALLTDEEIPPILEKLDETEQWIDAIRAYAQERAIQGHHWDGFKLVESRTLRKIPDQIAAVNRLTEAGYSVEDVTNTKLKGITDLERLLGKKRFGELLGAFIVKPKGEPTLVRQNDKRPEIDPLAEAFKEEI